MNKKERFMAAPKGGKPDRSRNKIKSGRFKE
jgi:hypothetical protein